MAETTQEPSAASRRRAKDTDNEKVAGQASQAQSKGREEQKAQAHQEQEAQQEEQKKGLLRHIYEFFIRLLGIGKKREGADAASGAARRDEPSNKSSSFSPGKPGRDEPGASGPSQDAKANTRSAPKEAPRNDQQASKEAARDSGIGADIAGGAAAGGAMGGAFAQRQLLEAAQAGSTGGPGASAAGSGPEQRGDDNGPGMPFESLRASAERVFSAHGDDLKSRIVPEASTDEQPVFDHTQPSYLDMELIDKELSNLMRCEGDTPTNDELISNYYAACMLGKLHELRSGDDTDLAGPRGDEAMARYLDEVEGEVEKIKGLDLDDEKRSTIREHLVERLSDAYEDIAPKGHGSFKSNVLDRPASSEGPGPQQGQHKNFSM